ncbi:MAG TPA: hypothetical protein RMH26_09310, partial [Polyangiaceae bacterium LLY-WYZ-15_(1-7)]|nr:hypothetical protein [Polyangiaceae bacterium LLY-WYZ-15_(1-7)]
MIRSTALSLALALALACGDDDGMSLPDATTDLDGGATLDGGGEDAGPPADGGRDAGPPPLCPTDTPVLDAASGTPAFAVVGSDYTSTSLALLGADGAVLDEGWIDSGTTDPGLVSTLGGDVVVASNGPAGTITIVDRFGVDVLSRFCLDGSLVGQLRATAVEGWGPNPRDFEVVDADEAWVSRYEPNPAEDAPTLERGTDLLGVNPTTMELDGGRVDLTVFSETVTGLDGEGMETDVAVAARPDAIVRRGDFLVVGLDRIPVDLFGEARGYGDGRAALVDLADGSVEPIELSGLANCGSVQAVPGSETDVIVACSGYSTMGFGDAAGERMTTGLVRLRVSAEGEVSEEQRWAATDDDDSIVAVGGLVVLGEDDVVGVAPGNFADVNDRLVRTNMATGVQEVVATAGGSFVLGGGATDGAG